MFEKEFQEWFELNKKWLYSMDHMQAAYSAWCAGAKQQQAVEHSVHTDAANVCGECGEPFEFCAMGHYDVEKARRG